MNKELLKQQLMEDEGIRLRPYKDSVGIWTCAIGRNLEHKGLSKDELFFLGIKASTKEEVISWLLEHGLSKEDCLYLLDNDIDDVYAQLKKQFSWFEFKPDVVQRVMCNLCFNIGLGRLLGFTKTLNAIKNDRWEVAATELLNSKYAIQTGARANRLAEALRSLPE